LKQDGGTVEGAGQAPLFLASGRPVTRLSLEDAPVLQRLLERCRDYYELVEGRPPIANAAIEELTEGPAERVPHDLLCLGVAGSDGQLAGMIGALRHHRRENQWYLGLMLLDPTLRGRGFGAETYRAFEEWIVGQGADSLLLAVVEANVRAARFWERMGFGWPRCYPERMLGLKRHVLIEVEKRLPEA
jgi:GNAT superfamily N-acetyltransferase